jgi:subtilisin family serine protease
MVKSLVASMSRKPFVLSLMLIASLGAAFLALAPVCGPLHHAKVAMGRDSSLDAVPGELLVKYRDPMLPLGRRIVNGAIGAKEIDKIDEINVSRVAVEPGLSLEEAARRYATVPQVEFAEPNVVFHTQVAPNDPLYASRQQWYYDLTGAPKAWDVTRGNPGIVVAVLDTGVDVNHPDLKNNIWTNAGEIPDNGVDDDGNGYVDDVHGYNFAARNVECAGSQEPANPDIEDDNGHGTFVAGIVAASGNNNIGVTGMAPNVKVLPVKALDCKGSGTALAATVGLLYAAKSGARVVNLSFGSDDVSEVLHAAVVEAHDHYGVVIVAAAGNAGSSKVTYPARDERVIAVSASDHSVTGAKASFSNWGPEVAVTVPGVDIASTLPAQFCGAEWSCIGNQPYAVGSGTSFSTPLVAGAAALILSKDPQLSPDQVKSRMMSSALDLPDGGFPHWDGAGRLQADLALEGKTYQVGVSGIVRN